MGASTKIIIGVEVSFSDFFVELENGVGCANGHPGEVGKFCSQCGVTISQFIRTVATDHLRKFCETLGISESSIMENPTMMELAIESNRGIYIGSESWLGKSDGYPECYVLGVSTLNTDSVDCSIDKTSSIAIPEFMESIKESYKLISACGFDSDNVRIYQTKYLTY